jgi:3-dehydroquinate synthase
MSVDMWMEHMARDKKVLNGQLRLVLLRTLGQACIADDVGKAELEGFLETVLAAT